MRRLLSPPALAAALLLAACDVPAEFPAPISAPGLATYDARLVGSWYSIGGEEDELLAAMLSAIPAPEAGLDVSGFMTFLSRREDTVDGVPQIEEGLEVSMVRWAAHPSVIDGQTYFNARLVDSVFIERDSGEAPDTEMIDAFAAGPGRGYSIFRADISDAGFLTIRPLWTEELEGLGYNSRRAKCGEDCSFEVFDLSPEELATLIRTAEPGTLFNRSVTLARIDAVYPPQPEE